MYGCDGLVLVVCTMDKAPINIEMYMRLAEYMTLGVGNYSPGQHRGK